MERIGYPLLFALIVLIMWSSALWLCNMPKYLLPSPKSICQAIWLDRCYLTSHGLTTLLEASLGFALAIFLGFLLGTIFSIFQFIERMILPYAIASQAVPIVAVAPLFILWLGNGLASKVAMA